MAWDWFIRISWCLLYTAVISFHFHLYKNVPPWFWILNHVFPNHLLCLLHSPRCNHIVAFSTPSLNSKVKLQPSVHSTGWYKSLYTWWLQYKNTQKCPKQFQSITMATLLELGITDGVIISIVSPWPWWSAAKQSDLSQVVRQERLWTLIVTCCTVIIRCD
jgi:hypothetical protein